MSSWTTVITCATASFTQKINTRSRQPHPGRAVWCLCFPSLVVSKWDGEFRFSVKIQMTTWLQSMWELITVFKGSRYLPRSEILPQEQAWIVTCTQRPVSTHSLGDQMSLAGVLKQGSVHLQFALRISLSSKFHSLCPVLFLSRKPMLVGLFFLNCKVLFFKGHFLKIDGLSAWTSFPMTATSWSGSSYPVETWHVLPSPATSSLLSPELDLLRLWGL